MFPFRTVALAAFLVTGCRLTSLGASQPIIQTAGSTGTSSAGTVPTGADPPAAAVWSSGINGGLEGQTVAAGWFDGAPVVLLGAPNNGSYTNAQVTALSPSLDWIGSWVDEDHESFNSQFGAATDIADDGALVAVGALDGQEIRGVQDGIAEVFDHLPSGAETASPVLLLHGDSGLRIRFGVSVVFADLDGDDRDLVVGAVGGSDDDQGPGMIYDFDRTLTGELGLAADSAAITGTDLRFGQHTVAWDSDGDGLDEIVTTSAADAVHFASPWSGNLVQADADATWTDPDSQDQLGEPFDVLGDLDGDGLDDLAIGANTFTGDVYRQGAVSIVPGGPLTSAAASDLPLRIVGVSAGEFVGSSSCGGDFDADGALDLAVAASHTNDVYLPGQVLGFLGPVAAGTWSPADAQFAITGESPGDMFGTGVAVVDADGDAYADVVVGAQGWHEVSGGAFLFLGADVAATLSGP